MIVSLFISVFFVAVIIFILGVEKESIVYNMISMILFILLMAQSIWITVPFMAASSTVTEHQYIEPGMIGICLALALCDVVLMIVEFMDKKRRRHGPFIPGG